MVKKCLDCRYHRIYWNGDEHRSKCDKYGKPIPCPTKYGYPDKIPWWCEEWKDDRTVTREN